MKTISHWIDGRIVPSTSGNSSPVFDPATGEQTAAVDLASITTAANIHRRETVGTDPNIAGSDL